MITFSFLFGLFELVRFVSGVMCVLYGKSRVSLR